MRLTVSGVLAKLMNVTPIELSWDIRSNDHSKVVCVSNEPCRIGPGFLGCDLKFSRFIKFSQFFAGCLLTTKIFNPVKKSLYLAIQHNHECSAQKVFSVSRTGCRFPLMAY